MLTDAQRDAFYTTCAQAINAVGRRRESLLLARLALLLADEAADFDRAMAAIDKALQDLPQPTLAP
ncbi:MAG: hypothetical protein WB821_15805 [Burkholderiaceae bacterium]